MKKITRSTVASTFGRNLKRIRRAQGRTQEEVARQAHVHRNSLRWIENGTRMPSLFIALKLAEVLGVGLSELLREEEPGTPGNGDSAGG